MSKYLCIKNKKATGKQLSDIFGVNTFKLPPHDVNKNLGWTLYCVNNTFKKNVKIAVNQMIDEGNYHWFTGHQKTGAFLRALDKGTAYTSLRELYTPEQLVKHCVNNGWLSVKSLTTNADLLFRKDNSLYYEFFCNVMGIELYLKIMFEINGKISVDIHES